MSNFRHLIVDGANIVHAWPELRRLAERDRAAARTLLGQQLTPIHDSGDVRVTIVFDGRGDEIVIERPFNHATFSVVYTPSSMTADDVIEQMVANSSCAADCCVATDDNAERETVAALGAVTLRSDDLAAWLKRALAQQLAKVKNIRAENTRVWRRS